MVIKRMLNNEFFRGGMILFIMMNFFNFLTYAFHFAMTRSLGPSGYGTFAVLMAIVYIFFIPAESLQIIVSRYTSKLNINKEFGKMKSFLYKSLKKGFKAGFLCFAIFIPVALFLKYFLNISFGLLIFTGLILIGVFTIPSIRGVIQGRKKFMSLGWSMILEGIIKLSAIIFVVFFGWYVYGAMAGFILGLITAFFISFLFIPEVVKSNKEKVDTKGIYSYSWPVLVALIAIVMFYSVDVILIKRIFIDNADIVGKYAVAALIGKAIFFGTAPISKAMFPISSEDMDNKKNSDKTLKRAILMVVLLCFAALVIFIAIPEIVVWIFSGTEFLEASKLIIYTGIAYSILSLANLIILQGLALKRTKRVPMLLIFVLVEIILLSLFNSSLVVFSAALVVSSLIFLIGSIWVMRK